MTTAGITVSKSTCACTVPIQTRRSMLPFPSQTLVWMGFIKTDKKYFRVVSYFMSECIPTLLYSFLVHCLERMIPVKYWLDIAHPDRPYFMYSPPCPSSLQRLDMVKTDKGK